MNIVELLQVYQVAILENSEVEAWSQVYYGRSAQVYIGVDQRNPPAETDYPLVHLFPGGKEVGIEVDDKPHLVGCTCGIYDAGEAEPAFDDGHTMLGIVRLEEFRKLVETALLSATPDGLYVGRIEIDYETVEFYPFHLVGMEITVKQPRNFRDDPFD